MNTWRLNNLLLINEWANDAIKQEIINYIKRSDKIRSVTQLCPTLCDSWGRKELSRGSAGEYQADEQAGVARLCWRVSGR